MMAQSQTAAGTTSGQKRKHKKWPWITLTILIVVLLAAWFGFNAFADNWIATNGSDPTPLPATSPFTGSTTVTYSGSLQAWYAPPKSGRPTVIIVHGYGANRTDHEQVGVALQASGYGVMAVDLGHENTGTKYGGGIKEASDVDAAVKYALAHGSTHVVLLGYSAGGTESVLAAAASSSVVAVVADSSPVSFVHLAEDRVPIPGWVFMPAPWMYSWFSSGGALGTLSSIGSGYHTPTLVIQGTGDKTVKPSNGPAVASITHGSLWTVSGAGHTATATMCPTAYVSQLTTFYSDALTGKPFVVNPAC